MMQSFAALKCACKKLIRLICRPCLSLRHAESMIICLMISVKKKHFTPPNVSTGLIRGITMVFSLRRAESGAGNVKISWILNVTIRSIIIWLFCISSWLCHFNGIETIYYGQQRHMDIHQQQIVHSCKMVNMVNITVYKLRRWRSILREAHLQTEHSTVLVLQFFRQDVSLRKKHGSIAVSIVTAACLVSHSLPNIFSDCVWYKFRGALLS